MVSAGFGWAAPAATRSRAAGMLSCGNTFAALAEGDDSDDSEEMGPPPSGTAAMPSTSVDALGDERSCAILSADSPDSDVLAAQLETFSPIQPGVPLAATPRAQ